jgi:hypothetical protein
MVTVEMEHRLKEAEKRSGTGAGISGAKFVIFLIDFKGIVKSWPKSTTEQDSAGKFRKGVNPAGQLFTGGV